MKHALIVTVLGCLISQSLPAQQVYKWFDEKGRVHFSDRPMNQNAETITIKQQPRISGGNGPKTTGHASRPNSTEKILNAYSQRRELKQQQNEQEKAEQQKLAAQQKKCDQLLNHLARSEGRRLYNLNDKGERIYLSDAEIEASRNKLQSDLNKHCR
ncbi:MAG TPA: DUF4124 domain-containing protein [Gammaproteobacteria bacterium]|jgi:hypothetical protein